MPETTSDVPFYSECDASFSADDGGAGSWWHEPVFSPAGGGGGGRAGKKTARKAAGKAAAKKAAKKSGAKGAGGKVAKKTTKKVAKKAASKKVAKKAASKVAKKSAGKGGAAAKPVARQATAESLERSGVKEGDLEVPRASGLAMVDEPVERRGSLGRVPRPSQDEVPDVPAAQPAAGEDRPDVGDRSNLPDRPEVDRGEADGPLGRHVEFDAHRPGDDRGRRDRDRERGGGGRGDRDRDRREGDRPEARRDDRGGHGGGHGPRGQQRHGGGGPGRDEARRDGRPDHRENGRDHGRGGGRPEARREERAHGPSRGPAQGPTRGPSQELAGGGGPPAVVEAELSRPIDPDHDRLDDAPPDEHVPLNPETFDTEKTFADLGLHPSIVRGVSDLGFRHPTHIQSKLVPVFLTGRDILGQAKTGTGKTAAFALPLLHMVKRGEWGQAMILAPTRELAIQIHSEFGKLGKHMPVRAVPIYGGQSIKTQAEKLQRGAEIIVGTPGRVMDMIERRLIDPRSVRFAVLDEVDRMLDIGFREDIRRILSKTPSERQTVMVSATIRGDIEDLARRYMRSPEKLVTTAGALTVEMVEQHYLSVEGWDKRRLLLHLLTHESPALTLVFCRLKRTVDELASYLNRHEIEAHAIHGDMSQSKRNSTMRELRSGKLAVLIASDLASRGIDVEGISHVVNYDLPEDPDLYVHRIGRTARAGRDGVAWAFVTPAQGKLLTQIENLINAQIPKMDYPDFQPSPRPEGYREESTGGRPIYEVQGVEKARNRYAESERPDLPAVVVAAPDPSKFPGGIVPTKMPPNRMRGRVKSGR